MQSPHEQRRIDGVRSRPTAGTRRPGRGGFTFVELTIVMVVTLVGLMMFGGTVIATGKQRQINRENALAAEAARAVLESMRNEEFGQVLALYNMDPADDPGGAGTAPGARFAVEGLEAPADSPDGLSGEVMFPLVNTNTEAAPVWELREDMVDAALGLPRDLDGDSVVDDQDHAGDYVRLPVRIRIEWQSNVAGSRFYETYTMLVEFRW